MNTFLLSITNQSRGTNNKNTKYMLNFKTTRSNDNQMSLLMGNAHPEKVRDAENDKQVVYDLTSKFLFARRIVGRQLPKNLSRIERMTQKKTEKPIADQNGGINN